MDWRKVVPNPSLSLARGAIRPWNGKRSAWERRMLKRFCEAEGIDSTTLGLLANSDFGGGGTNGEGYVLAGKYATTDKTTIGFTYYDVEKDPDEIFGSSFDIQTFQLDFGFKYK